MSNQCYECFKKDYKNATDGIVKKTDLHISRQSEPCKSCDKLKPIVISWKRISIFKYRIIRNINNMRECYKNNRKNDK